MGAGIVTSRLAGSMFGNILLGGGIGMIVDHSNGSAYNYPEWIKLVMGDSAAVFDRKDFVAGAPTQSRGSQVATENKAVATNKTEKVEQQAEKPAAAPTSDAAGDGAKAVAAPAN